jgi:sugar phosphate isomerase/epimerase
VKLSAVFHVHEGEDHADVARRAASLGYAGVSLGFDHRWTDEELIAIRTAFDEQALDIVELRCYCNFITPRDDEARRNAGRLGRALSAGAILNCDQAVTYAGSRSRDPDQPFASHPDNWSDATWELLVHRAWDLLDRTEDLGIRLCFEPNATTTLNSLESLADLCADMSTARVRIALDPAAIFTAKAAGNSRVALAEIFSALADTIAAARATDVELIDAGPEPVAREAPLGEGMLDYATYLQLVDALEEDIPVIVKAQPTDEAYRQALRFLRGAVPAS